MEKRVEVYIKDIVPEKRGKIMKILGVEREEEITEPIAVIERK